MSPARTTPGPWHVDSLRSDYRPIIRCGSDSLIAEVWSMDSELANAHLLAAAPDLLEALERLVSDDHAVYLNPMAIDDARAALKKARGQ